MNTETTETFAELEIPINPFPGLRPFEFNESHLFFGRDGQSEQLISKLGRTHFLAVVGTSGSGKSSLVRAGLLPALLGGFMSSAGSNWRIAIMRPGNDPIGNLARALNAPDVFGSEIRENAALQTVLAEATLQRGSRGLVDAVRQAVVAENENLLILVDQFEEIFRFAQVAEDKEYGNEAAAFVKLLLEAARQRELPIYVVLTMRSDYLGDCSQFWGLPEEINESQYLIPRLTRDQLREAMTGPINVARGQITPRLVARLLNDVGEDQDQLPVLQHLLMRVWDEWKEQRLEVEVKKDGTTTKATHRSMHEGDALDICCYDAVGGMTQALSRHADEAFNDLPNDAAREIAERLFKTLTEKGTDNREIRRPVTLGEICAALDASASEVINVIETFRRPGRSFLMPPAEMSLTADSLIDISHESLIRGWARLKQWVDEETRSARIYLRVAETAVLRDEGGAGLWRDPDLQIALTWRQQSKPNEIWARRYHTRFNLAMNFLDDSVAARDAEVEKEEARRKREIRRTRLTALILAVATVVSMLAGGYAIGQSVKARNAQLEAENQARLARYSFEEAEKQKANAEREKEGAIAAQKDAVRLKDEANEAKGRAEVSAAEAQANLVEANKQRIAAQKASELVKAEALKGQGLSALKEGNENAAIFYFNQLNEHYMKSNDQSGQSFALANIANIYKDRVPMFLNPSELDEVEEGSEDYAKVIRQYMQSYVFAAQVQDKGDETIKQEILKNSRQARENYEQALVANRDAARGNASRDLFLKRGNILQSIGDLYLYELQDEFKGDLTTKENTEKAFEKAVDYYTQAASAYEDAERPLEEAEMIKKMGDVLYKNWSNAVSRSEWTTAKAGRSEAPAARQSDSRTSQVQLGRVIGLYEKAKTQFEHAENPSRAAATLVRIANIYGDLPSESQERRNAINYLEQARVIYRNQKNFSKEAATAEKIAQLYEEMSDAKQQVSALKQALEAYGNAAAAKPKQRSEYEKKISDLLSSIGTGLFESSDKETVSRFFQEVVNRSDDQLLKGKHPGLDRDVLQRQGQRRGRPIPESQESGLSASAQLFRGRPCPLRNRFTTRRS